MADTSYSAILASGAALTQALVTIRSTDQKPSLALGDLKSGVYYIRLKTQLACEAKPTDSSCQAIGREPCLIKPRHCKHLNKRDLFTHQLIKFFGFKLAFARSIAGHAVFADIAVVAIVRQLLNRLPEQRNLLILRAGAIDQTLHGE